MKRSESSFINNANKILIANGIEPDKIDIKSRFDSSLTTSENLNIISKEYGVSPVNSEKDQAQYEDYISEKIKEHDDKIKIDKKMSQHFENLNRALDKLKNGFANIVMVKGRAGVGKSFNIKAFLKSNNMEYVVVKKITPAYFYRMLWENNGKVIWLKDVMRLFNDGELKEVIKAVGELEPEDRIITNYSYSIETRELPKQFICTSKFIFDYNTENIEQMKYKEDFQAIMSRAEYVEIVFDFKEMTDIMRKLAKTKEERIVTKFLIDNYKFVGTNAFNLRTQQKAFKTYLWAKATKRDWKAELKNELSMNLTPVRSFLYQFMGRFSVKAIDLKKNLLSSGYVATMKTADRRLANWIELGEVYSSMEMRNPFVSLFPFGNEKELTQETK